MFFYINSKGSNVSMKNHNCRNRLSIVSIYKEFDSVHDLYFIAIMIRIVMLAFIHEILSKVLCLKSECKTTTLLPSFMEENACSILFA